MDNFGLDKKIQFLAKKEKPVIRKPGGLYMKYYNIKVRILYNK